MVRKIWDDNSTALLIEKYPIMTVSELTKILPFTDTQIRKKAKTLNLKKEESGYSIVKWTKEEVEYLETNYEKYTAKELIKHFKNKFTEQQIRNKLYKLGLIKSNQWTDELVNYLYENYKVKSIEEMKKEMLHDFSEKAIYKKMYSIGIKLNKVKKWTKEEKDLLIKYYPIRTNNEMKEVLPQFTKAQIKAQAKNMGIKKHELIIYKSKHLSANPNKWTDEEKKILIEHYGKIPNKQIKLNHLPHKSLNAIKIQARKLHLQDKLRYQFEWQFNGMVYDEESPSSITITVKKRRLDQC